jgi:hypothetical protein
MTRTPAARSQTSQSSADQDACNSGHKRKLPLDLGKSLRDSEFLFDPDYHNLNHGSFGTIPSHIQSRLRHYQSLHERRPDQFIRYDFPALLDENREAAAKLINAPSTDEVVFVANATVGLNTGESQQSLLVSRSLMASGTLGSELTPRCPTLNSPTQLVLV